MKNFTIATLAFLLAIVSFFYLKDYKKLTEAQSRLETIERQYDCYGLAYREYIRKWNDTCRGFGLGNECILILTIKNKLDSDYLGDILICSGIK